MSNKKSIALALGGGAVLGAIHVGVLKALEELNYEVQYISGTSIGALISALYAFGHNAEKIESIVKDLGWLDVSTLSISKMGILSNTKLGKVIEENIGTLDFTDSKIPLAIVASDIVKGEKVVLREGNVAEAVIASTCIPGIFSPVEVNGQMLVDGGIIENIPISPLIEMGAQTIVSIDLTQVTNVMPKNIFDVLMNTFNIALNNAAKLQQEDASIILAPDLTEFNMVDTRQIPKLINKGYSFTIKELAKH